MSAFRMSWLVALLALSALAGCGGQNSAEQPTATPAPGSPALGERLGNTAVVALGPSGNIYVSGFSPQATFGRIVELSPSGKHLQQFLDRFSPTWDNGPFPVAVDSAGNVYTGLPNPGEIVKFAPNGSVVKTWSADYPQGIAIDSRGNIYVSDFDASDISVFAPSGKLLRTLGPDFHGKYLNTVAGIALGPDGNLYVSDHRDSRVVKMSTDGKWLATWGPHIVGLRPDLNHPEGIAVDPRGNVYASEPDSRIVELSTAGKYVRQIGSMATNTAEAAFDKRGTMYVADNGITKFSPTGKQLANWP